jgi:hypothetical protein
MGCPVHGMGGRRSLFNARREQLKFNSEKTFTREDDHNI